MKKFVLLIYCFFVAFLSFGQAGKTTLSIIPEPVKTIAGKGNFILPRHIVIEAGTTADQKAVTRFPQKQANKTNRCNGYSKELFDCTCNN